MNVEGYNSQESHAHVAKVQTDAYPCVRQPALNEIAYHLTAPGQPPLVQLDNLSFVMDRLFQIPGTRLRVGLNTILLVVPVLGDLIPSAVSVWILIIGLKHYRVPRIVAARMMLNTCLDAVLGWIPILGDLFDLFFKADTRNVRLLQQYAEVGDGTPRATWHHWVFVVGVLLFFGALCLVITLCTIALIRWMNHTVNHMFGGIAS